MNKKGEEDITGILTENLVYLVVLVIFLIGMVLFVRGQANGAEIWGDYYAKEIALLVDNSHVGDEITLDVHRLSEIAQKNGLNSRSEIFNFNNVNNEVCVKLSAGRALCYSYFNDVDVIDWRIDLAESGNVLYFKVSDLMRNG